MNNNKNTEHVISAAEALGCCVKRDEPLSKYTTFKIGGAASAVITVESITVLSQLLALCREHGVQRMIIGNGSNLLADDDGYDGVVLKLEGDFKSITSDGEIVRCGSGVTLATLCKFARDHSLGGIEFAWGIPGTVGGAAFMNAGAYGGEMKDVILSTSYITSDGITGSYVGGENDFSYRHSVYSDKDYVITAVTFKLAVDDPVLIKERMDDFMTRRKTKQPLDYPSAGSVFKRPEGFYAGQLIEECGLKGYSIGGAQVSEKHAGFIINKGGATCSDVCRLVEHIQKTVKENKGVTLECEIRRI